MTKKQITRDDLTVELGTAPWGGPTAKATVTAGPLEGRTFWLRSTEGLPGGDATNDLERGGGIHLDASDPDASIRGWMGAFKTYDMETALDWLVEEVNELALRAEIKDATWQQHGALESALEDFGYSLGEVTPRDWREEWQRVEEAFTALAMKIREVDQ